MFELRNQPPSGLFPKGDKLLCFTEIDSGISRKVWFDEDILLSERFFFGSQNSAPKEY